LNLLQVLNDIGDTFQQPITLVDVKLPDKPLVYVNQAFKDLTLYQNDQIIGKNCRFLQGPLTDPEAVTRTREAIENLNPICQDLVNYKSNGEVFYNRLVLIPFSRQSEKLFIGFQHEIPKEKFKQVHNIIEMDLLDKTINPLSIIVSFQMTKLPGFEKPIANAMLRLKNLVLSL
jgi:PAS domain S-box-containing protein